MFCQIIYVTHTPAYYTAPKTHLALSLRTKEHYYPHPLVITRKTEKPSTSQGIFFATIICPHVKRPVKMQGALQDQGKSSSLESFLPPKYTCFWETI